MILPVLTCLGALGAYEMLSFYPYSPPGRPYCPPLATGVGSNAQKITLANISSIQDLEIASVFLTVATNFMVTFLIIFYIHRERRALSDLQTAPLDTRLFTGPVALVVESALPLTVIGLAFIVLFIFTTRPIGIREIKLAGHIQIPVSFLFYALCVSCSSYRRVQ